MAPVNSDSSEELYKQPNRLTSKRAFQTEDNAISQKRLKSDVLEPQPDAPSHNFTQEGDVEVESTAVDEITQASCPVPYFSGGTLWEMNNPMYILSRDILETENDSAKPKQIDHAHIPPNLPRRNRRLYQKWTSASIAETSIFADYPSDLSGFTHRLRELFEDVDQYKQLLGHRGEPAQAILDSLQTLLYTSQEASFRRPLLVALQRLSKESGLHPTCFDIDNVELVGEHPVAAGGFADIYRGTLNGQGVCLKVIRVYQVSRVDCLYKRFCQEALLWGQLSHTNLLPFYGLYRFRSRLCLVAPYMENGDITHYLENYHGVNRILLATDVASGLSYLHDNGIIHGDLKGANVLVTNQGRACLADFGLSSVTDSQILNWTSQSSAASMGGSIRWQAPELFTVDEDDSIHNSKPSDVYAFSCVLYEIFTGKIPFVEVLRDTAVMFKTRSGIRPSRPADSNNAWLKWGLTDAIWGLMGDCWKENPTDRPPIEQAICRLQKCDVKDERPPETETVHLTRFRRSPEGDPNMTPADEYQNETLLPYFSYPGMDLETRLGLRQLTFYISRIPFLNSSAYQ